METYSKGDKVLYFETQWEVIATAEYVYSALIKCLVLKEINTSYKINVHLPNLNLKKLETKAAESICACKSKDLFMFGCKCGGV